MSLAGIRLAARSLQAMQTAIETAGQNVANADTPGYSRQVAVIRSVAGAGAAAASLGSTDPAAGGGADVAEISRARASWLDAEAGRLQAGSARTGLSSQYTTRVETLLAEPGDSGLSATLDRFFAAAASL